MFLSLTIICVVAGAILAGVNMYTTGPIAATKAAALEAAIKAVTPAFDNKPTEEAIYGSYSRWRLVENLPGKTRRQIRRCRSGEQHNERVRR